MADIGASKARANFFQLLDRVEKGEEITITRRGRVVAHLVSARPRHDIEKARATVASIRARAREMKLGPFDWEEWKACRDEGRR